MREDILTADSCDFWYVLNQMTKFYVTLYEWQARKPSTGVFFLKFLSLIPKKKKKLLYETLEGVGGDATFASLKKGDTILCGVLKSSFR